MLDNCSNNEERWNAVEGLLQTWLRERRDILVRYTALAATLDKSDDSNNLQSGLRALCQLLVDYVSVGHFEVFYELIREAEAFDDGSGKLASDIIPKIGDTTEVILGFDEKYPLPEGTVADYTADMSLLGEVLERRFELEDGLIAGLHKAHATLVAIQGV
ncbi:MAG: sigma D regulator [Gammaproteobacteria bacterium]|nr:sigma D regulator [Gammaproteobacteria bacterium]